MVNQRRTTANIIKIEIPKIGLWVKLKSLKCTKQNRDTTQVRKEQESRQRRKRHEKLEEIDHRRKTTSIYISKLFIWGVRSQRERQRLKIDF